MKPGVYCLHVNVRVNEDGSVELQGVAVGDTFQGECIEILDRVWEHLEAKGITRP